MITNEELNKAKEGDLQAIEKICTATWEPLYRYIYHKVQNREEAEDVLQETYVKTLKYIKKNKAPEENLIGFMKAVSLNVIRDNWRKNKRGGVLVNFPDINLKDAADREQQNDIVQRLLLESALAKLSEEHQTILDLRIIKGYSVSETSKVVGKSEGAVRTAQHRALQALAKILDGE